MSFQINLPLWPFKEPLGYVTVILKPWKTGHFSQADIPGPEKHDFGPYSGEQKCSDKGAERLRTWWALTGNKDTLSPIEFIKTRWLEWFFRFTTLIKLKFKVKATNRKQVENRENRWSQKTNHGDRRLYSCRVGWHNLLLLGSSNIFWSEMVCFEK